MSKPVEIFLCYAREDNGLRRGLEKHLRVLARQGVAHVWRDRDINAGMDWEREIDNHLNSARIILLLVSADFLDSDYCYGIEMKRAKVVQLLFLLFFVQFIGRKHLSVNFKHCLKTASLS